ncbi:MAG: chemotaxis protein CheA [candidate division Zixibacteria bacterium]|nr:chemotaxis protein CheA [candidate division Zixibacteria bacterium]
MPDDIDADFLSEFATESEEYLEQAEASLLTLETDPEDDEAINSIFRAFQTIKGTSAFLGLTQITELAHVVESMLGRVRDGSIKYTEVYADVALQSIDVMKSLTEIAKVGSPGQELATPAGLAEIHERLAHPDELEADSQAFESGAVDTTPRLGDIIVAENIATREQVEDVASSQAEDKLGVALVKSKTAKAIEVAQALRTQAKIAGPDRTASSTLRVRTDRLDLLIETVGELVIAQSMIAQDDTVHLGENHKLLKKVGHSGKIVRELQDLSMSMRMVPLKATFQKMARLVRDAAQKCGKSVQLITQGEDEEIDRNMVDIISDPLVHMVRNAVDHGIESAEVRSKANKPAQGTIRLAALRSGSNVLIKIEDDGAGLNRQRIVEKAIEKSLIESDKGMTDSEVFELIFRPGFSTVENVTDLSGRGVGMDVVKRGIDALGGRINIASEFGKGTEFIMQLPLTMAITDGMLVKVGKEHFIIPTININRSFRPNAEQISTVAGRGEMVLLHGQVIPVYRLYEIFGIKGAIEVMTDSLLVIVGDGKTPCAFMVDELLNQQQVVAKPIGDGLGKVSGVSGGAILGDGRVGLILDTIELATMARQSFRTTEIKQSSIAIKGSNGQKTVTIEQ